MSAPKQWRSLEALADTPAFRRFIEREYPAVTDLARGPERRTFLKLMAASFAMTGLTGCDEPEDKREYEVPYVRNPVRMLPSVPLQYASVSVMDGFANGVLVTTVNGRPLKIEGNPQHPWSRGGTDAQMQASVLGLYDQERSKTVRRLGRASNWAAFRGAMTGPFAALRENGGLRLLTGAVTSPLLLAQIAAMRAAYPGMVWHAHAPAGREAVYEGAKLAFGQRLETRWRLDRARVIVALDGDFLDAGPQQVGLARDWAAARRAAAGQGRLLTLHAAGPVPNLTSAKADHAVPVRQSDMLGLVQAMLAEVEGQAAAGTTPVDVWRTRAMAALRAARGAGVVTAGAGQPPPVHAAVHRLNAALGNVGETVLFTQPAMPEAETLANLVDAMRAGSVQAVLMLDTNPAYNAPGSLGFTAALARVPLKIHAGQHVNETALRCDWHLPTAHPLETWGDARSLDGTIGLMQPTIEPLYQGRPAAEIVAMLTDGREHAPRDLLRAQYPVDDAAWETMLGDGFVPGSAFAPVDVQLSGSAAPAEAATAGFDVLFRPDPCVWDGSLANNGWLQELPKPLTKLVWENAITIGPAAARQAGVATGDVVRIEAGGRALEGPAWVLPGQADGVLGVTLGYGRVVPGNLADGFGYNAYALRDAGSPLVLSGAVLRKTGRVQTFATTQDHSTMEGHDLVRVQALGAAPVGETASFTQPTLYPPKEGGDRAWGMVIDLDACTGCNACVTACQSENNIAVVGREQVALGREMHWLRIDRYYEGPAEAPVTHFQPVPCMHCENAPCEVGCPVEATLHDEEGLNLMVYNRCIGTRACSGYCPYKVRRFNYLDYSAGASPSRALQYNVEVTVRARGVMEKCTYCVQRIAAARIEAGKTDQPIADGAVVTACQGACPTQAISFGDLNDNQAAVVAARRDPRNYALLGELNVRPRTTYLAKLAPGGAG